MPFDEARGRTQRPQSADAMQRSPGAAGTVYLVSVTFVKPRGLSGL